VCGLVVGLFGGGVGVAWGDCGGCLPWWHVVVGSRPVVLGSGGGRDEVQGVVVSPGGGGSWFELYVALPSGKKRFVGEWASEPLAAEVGVERLSAGAVQAALESRAYGVGNVVVSEVSGGGGVVSFRVVTGGGLADRSVEGLSAFGVEGSASASVVSRGVADDQLFLVASDVGDAGVDGELLPVVLKDRVPAGFTAVEYEAVSGDGAGRGVSSHGFREVSCELDTPGEPGVTSCLFAGQQESGAAKVLPVFGQIEVRVGVDVTGSPRSGELDVGSVSGGGALVPVSVSRPVRVGVRGGSFGIEDWEVLPELEGGVPDRQAGSHPFQATFQVDLNEGEAFTGLTGEPEVEPAGLIKTFRSSLPPGFVGDAVAFPRCSLPEFQAKSCPEGSIVGVAVVRVNEPTEVGLKSFAVPVFNLEAGAGEPARFGFLPTKETPVFLDTSVRSGGDYGVTAQTSNIVQVAGDLRAQVTLWGVPGDPRHNSARGGCLESGWGPCESPEAVNPPAFLTLPSSCTGHPLVSYAEAVAWEGSVAPSVVSTDDFAVMPTLVGCNRVPFEPSIRVVPSTGQAARPLGLTTDLHVPQEGLLNGSSLAQSDVRDVSVTLPEGVALNAAAGDGLQACSEALVGYEGERELDPVTEPGGKLLTFSGSLPEPLLPGVSFCATASKVGEATIKTPLLQGPVTGGVYVASQEANPFGGLFAIYVVAEEKTSKVLVKLAGDLHVSGSGQVTATFEDDPQTPFEDAELRFFGEERASLSSPAKCGSYQTTSSITPWSEEPFDVEAVTAHPSASFQVTQGSGGGACPGSSLPFSPVLAAGSSTVQAGQFSPFSTSINRENGQQTITGVQVTGPPGLSGVLKGVELCGETAADEGLCGAGSLIGESTVSVGVGGTPLTIGGGRVYLTGAYQGAPFGLSIVSPAKAGPYDLENTRASHPRCDCVVVRAKVALNPETAALTVTTNPSGTPYGIPPSLEGVPLQIQHINVTVTRPKFVFNPSSCKPGLAITAVITGSEGATQIAGSPFQAANCALLRFSPKLSVSATGHASKRHGEGLKFKLAYPPGAFGTQAWIREAKFDIPKQMPSRLETIQQACLAATFEKDRAACPKYSVIGTAIAHTELIPEPLKGSIYFVSYGSAKFPDAVFVLKGYGITIEMHGHTFISKTTGITSVTFNNPPQVPFENIEVTLPTGSYSEFGANLPHGSYDYCGRKLTLPNTLTATNGQTTSQNTPITITGCKTPHKHTTKKH
jgi:hypothetical protein